MTRLGRFVRNFLHGLAITVAFLLCPGGVVHSENTLNYPGVQSRPEASYLDQGWGYDTAE
jgi:hypothetical protein